MPKDLPSLLLLGALAALAEVLWTWLSAGSLFLSASEVGGFSLAAFTALPTCVVLVGGLLSGAVGGRKRRTGPVTVALLGGAVGAWALWLITDGRRVRDLAVRPLVVLVLAAGLAAAAYLLLRRVQRLRERSGPVRKWTALALFGVVVAALVVDGTVLVRGYPAFHHALALGALFVAACAGLVAPPLPVPAAQALSGPLAILIGLTAPWALGELGAAPNAGFVAGSYAPWTGKLLWAAPAASRAAPEVTVEASATLQKPGIDLQDRDVLWITVDALRADALGAYGGPGITPALDALAQNAAVFTRAYTPTPHTSYALASLLTGKFLRPVLELPGAPAEHPTVPDLLRRYGYRTAAFYPPAIFFVDGSRFDSLRRRRFGFEYQKEMFASGDERVEQLREYLQRAPAERPLFVWVHLFEPHEPYDPPAGFARGDSARQRYDGEVAYADAAIGKLVEVFRQRQADATVIVSADHGEEFGEHGGFYHGTTLYDEQARVPLLWSSPGRVAPSRLSAPVELVDIATTLLSAAGVARDARMRGDDLGPLLAGHEDEGPAHAFAVVDDLHMVTDGRHKALCDVDGRCRLHDLQADPQERRNVALERPGVLEGLRAALRQFLGSIPQMEALAVDDGVAWPAALAQAELGAPGAESGLVPLLSHDRATVRAAAARLLARAGAVSTSATLERLRKSDTDARVRQEAAVAALRLGSAAAAPQVVAALDSADMQLRRRAALALAAVPQPDGLPVLSHLALDEDADEAKRIEAIQALGALNEPQAVPPLVQLLEDVRLRVEAANSLGVLGGKAAADALAAALERERYQPARRAQARALQRLGDPRLGGLVRRTLGYATSLPDGVRILLEEGALRRGSGAGVALAQGEDALSGGWRCSPEEPGCALVKTAEVELPRRGAVRGPARAVWLLQAPSAGATVTINDQVFALSAGEQQVSHLFESGKGQPRFELSAPTEVRVLAMAVVPARDEIPPPEPEPWDADEQTPP